MKKYKVIASFVTYCSAEIEAETEDEAFETALQMDGTDFDHETTDYWEIDEVKEIK
jgi:hypothetical protein